MTLKRNGEGGKVVSFDMLWLWGKHLKGMITPLGSAAKKCSHFVAMVEIKLQLEENTLVIRYKVEKTPSSADERFLWE